MRPDHALQDELRALGDDIAVPPPDDDQMVAVMARIADEPVPRRAGLSAVISGWARAVRDRRRAAAAVLAGLLIAGVLTPPVRAAVAEWFGFGGVLVHIDDTRTQVTTAPPPPTAGPNADLAAAAEQVRFDPVVPAELGNPTGVEVSDDGIVLSMTWEGSSDGTVRLDQFDGTISPMFTKIAGSAEFIEVGGQEALWFPEPHEVVILGPDGSERTETARLAGQTLIWQRDGITLRLEGDLTRSRAVAIAESVPG